jgi:hypothetical protein
MSAKRVPYVIWRRQHNHGGWLRTARTFSARSEKDAAAKVRRMFAGAGFSSMSLVALPEGVTP